MASKNLNIVPGWKMTKAQVYGPNGYFKMFARVAAVKGWTGNAEQMSAHRREWHVLAGLGPISAKHIDRMKGFDRLKESFLAITQPDNLHAQMAMENQPRHRLITRITGMCHEEFWRALLRSDRFKAAELDDLSDRELENFRNTLEARIRANGGLPATVPEAAVETEPELEGQPF